LISGFGGDGQLQTSVVQTGATHPATATAATAKCALLIAYNDAKDRTDCPTAISGDIGGQMLWPGLYTAATSLEIVTDVLTLNGGGDANAVFIFQIGTTLQVGNSIVAVNGTEVGPF
jgi:hypothetical protein